MKPTYTPSHLSHLRRKKRKKKKKKKEKKGGFGQMSVVGVGIDRPETMTCRIIRTWVVL
jgi:hypothetical protein